MKRLRYVFDEGRYSSLVLVLVAAEGALMSSVNDLVNDLAWTSRDFSIFATRPAGVREDTRMGTRGGWSRWWRGLRTVAKRRHDKRREQTHLQL